MAKRILIRSVVWCWLVGAAFYWWLFWHSEGETTESVLPDGSSSIAVTVHPATVTPTAITVAVIACLAGVTTVVLWQLRRARMVPGKD